jgi:hypothetical protein
MIYIQTINGKNSIALPVKKVVGEIKKGKNLIRKVEGSVALNFAITSNFFNLGNIDKKYSCEGNNVNPPLYLSSIPEDAQSLVLIVDDIDASNYNHWLLWNITSTITEISEDSVPNLAIQGKNDEGNIDYTGPCSSSSHRYSFKLYSIDKNITLSEGSTRAQLENEMTGHVINKIELIGYYG